jgi:Protein of unknown function (DUF2441)
MRMVEMITDRVLYHVTPSRELYHRHTGKLYKRPLAANQVVHAGYGANPFFSHYEGALELPLEREDGSTQQVKSFDFLIRMRNNKINSPKFAVIATDIAEHYLALAREILMESIRLIEIPDAPSRQTCLYLCENLEQAQYWNWRLGQGGAICSLRCTGVVHRADAGLLLGDSEPLSVAQERAGRYWRGEASDLPKWETLFVGKAVVLKIGLYATNPPVMFF